MITDYTCRPVYLRTDRQTHSLNEWMTWWCDDNARWRSTELTCHNFFGFVVGQEKLNEFCNYWAVIAGWYDTTSAALHSRFNFRVSPSNTQLVASSSLAVDIQSLSRSEWTNGGWLIKVRTTRYTFSKRHSRHSSHSRNEHKDATECCVSVWLMCVG